MLSLDLTNKSAGMLMREAVRRAMAEIRGQRLVFEVQAKKGLDGRKDMLTTADAAAQAIYLDILQSCFTGVGVIAEEKALHIPCRIPGIKAYFTVDPLDGTKAYVRRQSQGVGTMLALVLDGVVIAAYVGDVNTQEIYGFRPDDGVRRFPEVGKGEMLVVDGQRKLSDQYLLLGDRPQVFGQQIARLARPLKSGGAFKSIQIESGSIGIRFARLWKGEVGAIALEKGLVTPWDFAPIYGISKAMGFVLVSYHRRSRTWGEATVELSEAAGRSNVPILVVHSSRIKELNRVWRAHC